MVNFRYEFHLHRLKRIRVGDYDVLAKRPVPNIKRGTKEMQVKNERTISKRPPSYGVPSGPGKDPFKWKGDSSMGSILICEVLSFLQSSGVEVRVGSRR